ncbi:MAG TPA: hypothetical protein VHS32_06255 [Streptosporangiaceae bacterium]|nr:hypothetical protein [Streptosporangiaceae bacterium]
MLTVRKPATGLPGVISALNAKSSTGNLAKLDGSYLVTSFAMSTSLARQGHRSPRLLGP